MPSSVGEVAETISAVEVFLAVNSKAENPKPGQNIFSCQQNIREGLLPQGAAEGSGGAAPRNAVKLEASG